MIQAKKKGAKKILVLMNPPYAEAMNSGKTSGNTQIESKVGVADNNAAYRMSELGYASRELFVQFILRISKEIPSSTLAMFSTLKYVNAPNFELFRTQWRANYLGGFVFPSCLFEGLSGDFPVGFLVWKLRQEDVVATRFDSIETRVLDDNVEYVGQKIFYDVPADKLLGEWIERPGPNGVETIPLSNALTPAKGSKDVRGVRGTDGMIGGMMAKGSDLQNAGTSTAIFSSGYASAGGFRLTKGNLWQAAIVFAVRRLIKPTWLNDRDQFLQPSEPLTDEFKSDCLIWMLFNGGSVPP